MVGVSIAHCSAVVALPELSIYYVVILHYICVGIKQLQIYIAVDEVFKYYFSL